MTAGMFGLWPVEIGGGYTSSSNCKSLKILYVIVSGGAVVMAIKMTSRLLKSLVKRDHMI